MQKFGNVIIQGNVPDNPKAIMIDLPHGLGDQIMCLPLVYSLRLSYPQASIVVFTPNSMSGKLLGGIAQIDHVHVIPVKFNLGGVIKFLIRDYPGLRTFVHEHSVDMYVVPHVNPLRKLLARILPVCCSVLNYEHTHKSKESANICEALGISFVPNYNIQLKNQDVLPSLKNQDYILVDLYAQHLEKDPRQWPHFNTLIDYMLENGHKVVITGLNPKHQTRKDCIDLVNSLSFSQMLSVVAGASLVIAMDTGYFHFAYALGVPVLGIFGPVNPADRKPVGAMNVRTMYTSLPCSPCIVNRVDIPCVNREYPWRCLKEISPEMVYQNVQEMLNLS